MGLPDAPAPPVVIRRWVQLVLLPLAVLAVWALARAAGSLFLVLVVACLVALVLAPSVALIARVLPRGLLSSVISIGIDLVLVLVLSIYLLVYGRQIGELARRVMPRGGGDPDDDYPRQVQRAVSGYVRGQLAFSLVMGSSAALLVTIFGLVGLFPAGTSYSWFFGSFYALMEFIPYVGPIIGPIPALLVALFEHPVDAVWLLIGFVALQQLEGHVIAPQLFRLSLRINPILIILALLIGDRLYGIPGALVALPVIAVIRTTVLYLHGHTVLESWGRPDRGPASAVPGTIVLGPPPAAGP